MAKIGRDVVDSDPARDRSDRDASEVSPAKDSGFRTIESAARFRDELLAEWDSGVGRLLDATRVA